MDLREELTLDEIPQGVIDELKEHFAKVTFELDSDIDAETRSLKSNYTHQINDELMTETVVCDPDSFKPLMVPCNGYLNQTYILRVNETPDNGILVRRVLEAGVLVKEVT